MHRQASLACIRLTVERLANGWPEPEGQTYLLEVATAWRAAHRIAAHQPSEDLLSTFRLVAELATHGRPEAQQAWADTAEDLARYLAGEQEDQK